MVISKKGKKQKFQDPALDPKSLGNQDPGLNDNVNNWLNIWSISSFVNGIIKNIA